MMRLCLLILAGFGGTGDRRAGSTAVRLFRYDLSTCRWRNAAAGGHAQEPLLRVTAQRRGRVRAMFGGFNCDGCHAGGAVGVQQGRAWPMGAGATGGRMAPCSCRSSTAGPAGCRPSAASWGPDAVWTVVAYLKAQAVPPVVPTTSWLPGGSASAEPLGARARHPTVERWETGHARQSWYVVRPPRPRPSPPAGRRRSLRRRATTRRSISSASGGRRLQFTSGAFAPVKDLEFMYVFNPGGAIDGVVELRCRRRRCRRPTESGARSVPREFEARVPSST